MNDWRWQCLLVGISIALVPLSHATFWWPDKQFHNFIFNINFIPLLAAAMLFGWRGAAVATSLTLLAEAPILWKLWPHDPTYRLDQIAETAASGASAIVVGVLAGRTRRQRERLENARREFEGMKAELNNNIEKLKRAERLSATAQLSASLAHEIRNPLAGIAGAAGVLRRGNSGEANARECLDIIDRESQRLNKLLADFLSFARPRTPRLQPADLGAVIDSVVAIARHSPNAGCVEFRRIIADDMPEVQCDSEQIKQVLLNLVVNAIDATRGGRVQLTARVINGTAFVCVSDEGPGIPEADIERIFEPFYTTKEHGNGLGLAIGSKIVEQHGGKLMARNAPGRGLTMELHLPLRPGI